jgi:hypothetical protein
VASTTQLKKNYGKLLASTSRVVGQAKQFSKRIVSRAYEHDGVRIPPTPPPHKGEAKKKNQRPTTPQPTLPAVRQAVLKLMMRSIRRRRRLPPNQGRHQTAA